jgi:Arc/MetJ-type ribon-helix-helix transcriptional regulator
MVKLGIVITEEMRDWLEQPLGYGDSRSERIRNCLSKWRAAEEELVRAGFDPGSIDEEDAREMARLWIDEAEQKQPAD